MTPTYVLVHGSYANAFCWAPLQRELALRGHRTLAVDMPGHGYGGTFPAAYQAPQDLAALATSPSGMAGVTVAQGVEHVVDVVRRVREHGPVVLVGHSRGGFALTGAANAMPELIDRLVYISAWCCVDLTVSEYQQTPEAATDALTKAAGALVGDIAALNAVRLNWRTADPELQAVLKGALLADGTDDEYRAFVNTMEPDESLETDAERADAATWGRVPRTYIRLLRDRMVPPALQDRFIREADARTPENPFRVRSLDSGHVGFLLHPAEAATLLTE